MDVMYLRMLFYARLSALWRERMELFCQASDVSQVRAEETSAAQASTRLADLYALAQQLHDNSAAEFSTYVQLTFAFQCGVSDSACGYTVQHECAYKHIYAFAKL